MEPLDAQASKAVFGGASFPLRHRLIRAGWIIVWTVGARWTPPFMHGWRRLLLLAFGAKVAKDAHIYGSARNRYPPNLSVGRGAAIGPGANCYDVARIEIGDYAIVSQGVHLCGGTHDIDDPWMQLVARPIRIGNHAWVAAGAFVGPGTTLCEGAVLGARGVVSGKTLEAWTVYVGNPARRVRDRKRPPLPAPERR